MPEVNKDRYDLLTKLTKGFYDECAVQIDAAYAKEQARFVDLLLHAPAADADEAIGAMKEIYDKGKEETEKIRDEKLKEIEEAYQRYLTDNNQYDAADESDDEMEISHDAEVEALFN